MIREIIAILPGSFREGVNWIKENRKDGNIYVIINSPGDCKRFNWDNYITVGTFLQREDANVLLEAMRQQMRKR